MALQAQEIEPTAPRDILPAVTRREFVVVLLCALLLAAWPLRAALLDGSRVLLGVDTASTQLPWSAVLEAEGVELAQGRPRNPELSDQGMVFYPYHRWVAESWLGGDPPLWNPLVYTGAPGIGNPQAGVVDPQTLFLVGLEALGGPALFDRGYSLGAWLRLAAAGLGAYLLARRLGLGRPGAGLAGAGFAFSGYLILWMGAPLGHVPPLLPWVLLGVEGCRAERPRWAMLGTALALALAILAGHPETGFYVGLTAGLWAFAVGWDGYRAGRRALLALGLGTLVSAVSLLPFVEYLLSSGAHAVRSQHQGAEPIDLMALGSLLVFFGLCLTWRLAANRVPAEEELEQGEQPGPAPRTGLGLGALGLALAGGGVALFLRSRGLVETAVLALEHDRLGASGDGRYGYFGPGSFLEEASVWISPLCLALAIAALLRPEGRLARRRLIGALGLLAWLLCLRTPGLLGLYELLPLVGLGATVRLGAVSALLLPLLAGEALEGARRLPRLAGALLVLAFWGALAWERPVGSLPEGASGAPVADELVGFVSWPEPELSFESARVVGWIHPELPVSAANLRVERLASAGEVEAGSRKDLPVDLFSSPPPGVEPDQSQDAPTAARWFRVPYLMPRFLEAGPWRFTLELFGAEGELLGERSAGHSLVERAPAGRALTRWLVLAGLAILVLLPAGGAWSWVIVALVLAQGALFARGQNPAVPRSEVFPETRTEALLEELLADGGRFFSEPGALPPCTGMVRGLRALDGYDGMDPARYNAYKQLVLGGAQNALLAWRVRGVDLASPTFRLLGVRALALVAPLEHPDWELVAGPGSPAGEAECWIYRARSPLPLAFCVPRVVSLEELRAQMPSWNPLESAHVAGDVRLSRPYTHAEVQPPQFEGNNRVRVRASLDGDGLLVLTEGYFPGWRVTVDGEPAQLQLVNAQFRGVLLEAGEHSVVFEYRPRSVLLGAVLSLAALLALGWIWLGRGSAHVLEDPVEGRSRPVG